MRTGLFSIDGKKYDVEILSLERSFEVLDTKKSGRAISGDMVRSIIGTYYNYTMQIDTNRLKRSEYNDLYEVLSAPVEKHITTFPYGDSTITQSMYVTSGKDSLIIDDQGNAWDGLTINYVAMSPKRRPQ